MSVLVIAEHDNAHLKGATLNTIAAALKCGSEVHVLVAGAGCAAVAVSAASAVGVSKVLLADNAAFADGLAENVRCSSASHCSFLIATFFFLQLRLAKNIAPRVAAKLDVAQISDITKVDAADTFERPIYAGNAIATVQSADAFKVITVRTTGFDPVAATGGSAAVEKHRRYCRLWQEQLCWARCD